MVPLKTYIYHITSRITSLKKNDFVHVQYSLSENSSSLTCSPFHRIFPTEFMEAPEWDWHDAFPQRLSTSSGVIRNIIILASPGTDLVDFKGAFVLASGETQLLKYKF